MNTFFKNYIYRRWAVLCRLIMLMTLGVLFLSCEKALEPEFPEFLLSEGAVFQDASTVEAALSNIYAGLRDNSIVNGSPRGISVLLGLYADELDYYRADSPLDNAFYHHTVLPNNSAVSDFWNNSYSLIYNTNVIIEGLKHAPLEETEKNQFLGEALFLRGYLHYNLAQLFGDIPYIKTTDYIENAAVSRMPLTEVYQFMEEDLRTAKSLLPIIETSGERLRVSKGVASAMLARLYLYTEQWEKTVTESTAVIAEGTYTWQPDLNLVFLKESPSTIWQLKPQFEGSATKEGENFIFDFGPPSLYALTPNFMGDFESGDLRRAAWTREISNGSVSWYHPYKYKQNMFAGSSTEYSILFRLAEQYLIRAEANLEMGKLQEVRNDINVIRLRAGLEPAAANTQEEVRNELINQWRYEFFTEFGHRWFDLKRTDTAAGVLGPVKQGWKATDILFPLPANELILNPNLNPQNPGY